MTIESSGEGKSGSEPTASLPAAPNIPTTSESGPGTGQHTTLGSVTVTGMAAEDTANLSSQSVLSEAEDEEAESGQGDDADPSKILDGVPDDIEDLDMTHARLRSLEELRFSRFRRLKVLGLRQNLITTIGGLDNLPSLQELDLYDNKISRIENLEGVPNLTYLDLSFNKIRHIQKVDHLVRLTDLFFVANKIENIERLAPLVNLTNLELGANRIRRIEGLETLVNLTKLWLGKNKISKLENLDTLVNLKILSIQVNRIQKIEGLERLVGLEEIYLSHNGVKKIEGLENCSQLRVLDLGTNFVVKVENLESNKLLEELWLNNNQIPVIDAHMEGQLKDKEHLNTLYLEGNPLQQASGPTYRLKVHLMVPQVTQIDATVFRPQPFAQ
ncbi:protein phosphatase 1 regulatory subunit SDS22 [Zopfochytrium polystomum]|nr:protein phosphatase 1 regulatory subunit SDS22 [Zopfochytrium polystomum]